jgi:hypothetical protein
MNTIWGSLSYIRHALSTDAPVIRMPVTLWLQNKNTNTIIKCLTCFRRRPPNKSWKDKNVAQLQQTQWTKKRIHSNSNQTENMRGPWTQAPRCWHHDYCSLYHTSKIIASWWAVPHIQNQSQFVTSASSCGQPKTGGDEDLGGWAWMLTVLHWKNTKSTEYSPERQTVAQRVKKFPALYEPWSHRPSVTSKHAALLWRVVNPLAQPLNWRTTPVDCPGLPMQYTRHI